MLANSGDIFLPPKMHANCPLKEKGYIKVTSEYICDYGARIAEKHILGRNFCFVFIKFCAILSQFCVLDMQYFHIFPMYCYSHHIFGSTRMLMHPFLNCKNLVFLFTMYFVTYLLSYCRYYHLLNT